MGMATERQSKDQIVNMVNEFCDAKGFKERMTEEFSREDVIMEINEGIAAGDEVPRVIYSVLEEEGFWDEHMDGSDDLEETFVEWFDETYG